MIYPDWLNTILRCPETGQPLTLVEGGYRRSDGKLYPIREGILSIVYPENLAGQDAQLNRMYDMMAPIYDWSERVLGRLITGVDVVAGRQEIVAHLGLQPGMRLLEVSPGPGVFQPLLRQAIGDVGELVALDLSLGMLRQCQRRSRHLRVHLIHANAEYLPFADESFDALFHFGGVNLFNEPERALCEFVRVVRAGGVVSWGDEGFAPDLPDDPRKRILSRMNPGYLKPRPPMPDGLTDARTWAVYGGYAYLVVATKSIDTRF